MFLYQFGPLDASRNIMKPPNALIAAMSIMPHINGVAGDSFKISTQIKTDTMPSTIAYATTWALLRIPLRVLKPLTALHCGQTTACGSMLDLQNGQVCVGASFMFELIIIYFLDNLISRLALLRKGFRNSMAKTIRSKGHQALCEAIIAARNDAGLTQAGLAKRLRCHQSFVARVESGERRVDVIELIVLARAIGLSSIKFLEIAEQATPPDHRI